MTLCLDGTVCCLCLYSNNCNEDIKKQSLNSGKNQPEKTIGLEFVFQKECITILRTIVIGLSMNQFIPELVSL